jgi:hypothetical protein
MRSWTSEESQVESCEHQDNANIHCQPFPESVSEEHDIYADYDGYHRHRVKHSSYLSAHFDRTSLHQFGLDSLRACRPCALSASSPGAGCKRLPSRFNANSVHCRISHCEIALANTVTTTLRWKP